MVTPPCCGSGAARLLPESAVNVVVIGPESSGKTTLCWQVHDKHAQKHATGQKPMPTLGANKLDPIEGIGERETTVRLYDLGGRDSCRGIWKSYFHKVHAVIFVVDASAPTDSAKQILCKATQHEDLRGKPLLVVCNKQDGDTCVGAVRMSKKLDLKNQGTDSYRIIETVGTDTHTSSVFRGGIGWLADQVMNQYETLDKRVREALEKEREAAESTLRESEAVVSKVREKRQRALEREMKKIEGKSADDGKPIQICLNCNDALATTKSLASAWRPVCAPCNKVLKVKYKKKYGGVKCIICGRKAVKKSSRVKWKPVCGVCDKRLEAGESKEDILASPSAVDEEPEEEEEEEEEDAPTSLSASVLQNVTGTYRTGDDCIEHVRMIGNQHVVFHDNANGYWATFTITSDRKVRLAVLEDDSSYTGTLSENNREVIVTWSDGDTWTQTKEVGSMKADTSSADCRILERMCGEWRTGQGTLEKVRIPSTYEGIPSSLDVSHDLHLEKGSKTFKWGSIARTARSLSGDPSDGEADASIVLTTTDGETVDGTLSGSTITWSDGDRWVSVPRAFAFVAGHYTTSDGSVETIFALDHTCKSVSFEVRHGDDVASWASFAVHDSKGGRVSSAASVASIALQLTDCEDSSTYDATLKADLSSSSCSITFSDGDEWRRTMTDSEISTLRSFFEELARTKKLLDPSRMSKMPSRKKSKKKKKTKKKKKIKTKVETPKKMEAAGRERPEKLVIPSPTKVIHRCDPESKTPCKGPSPAKMKKRSVV